MSTPGASARRADALRNRQLALQAATELLAEPGTSLTVEAIAKRAGLGAATVVRAFGGKDALIDTALAGLLEPVVRRARMLLASSRPEQALRTFLAELIAFQAAHHAMGDHLGGLHLPASATLEAELVQSVQQMIARARADRTIRDDIDPAVTTTLISQTTYAIARAQSGTQELADAFITVLMDGLRPQHGRPPDTHRGADRVERYVEANAKEPLDQ